MKIFIIFASALLTFYSRYNTFAQTSDIDERKTQISRVYNLALDHMNNYFTKKSPLSFELAKEQFAIGDSMIIDIIKCCSNELDTFPLSYLRISSKRYLNTTLQELKEDAITGNIGQLKFEGETYLISSTIMSHMTSISIFKKYVKQLNSKYLDGTFYCEWSNDLGSFSMKAFVNKKWLLKTEDDDLNAIPVTFEMSNQTNNDIKLSPITEIFAIVNGTGKLYNNIRYDTELFAEISRKYDGDSPQPFVKPITINKNKKMSINVFFPRFASYPDSWDKIIFSPTFDPISDILSQKELIKIK